MKKKTETKKTNMLTLWKSSGIFWIESQRGWNEPRMPELHPAGARVQKLPPPHVFSLMLIYIALNIAVILPEEHTAKQRGYDQPPWHIIPGMRKKKWGGGGRVFSEWRNFALAAKEQPQEWIRGHVRQPYPHTMCIKPVTMWCNVVVKSHSW